MNWSNGASWQSDGGWYKNVSSGGGYAGPMDVAGYTSPYACWSLRAGSAAIAAAATQNLIDIADQSFANPLTVKCTTSGDLNTAAISAWVTAHSVTTIQITKIYDQSGNGHDASQSGIANTPTLLLSTLNGKAVAYFNATANPGNEPSLLTGNVPSASSQPFTFSGIINPIGTSQGRILCNNSDIQFVYDTSGSNDFLYAGTVQSFAPITGWQSVAGVFNTSSSTINLSNSGNNPSGTPTALGGSIGTNTLNASQPFSLASRSIPGDLAGNFQMLEMLVTLTAVSSANQASLISNQRAYGAY